MSLSLLRRWIQSDKIANVIGMSVSQFWLDWIEQHLLPYKQYIAFYVRFRIRHFDECSNSANESMNRSLKHSCIKVDGNTRLDDSTMKISSNALYKNKIDESKISRSLLVAPMWSKSNTAFHLTTFAEGLLRQQYLYCSNHMCVQVNENLWYVISRQQQSHN